MINQLINFAASIPPEKLKKLNKPKTGLHIRISIKTEENGRQYLAENEAELSYWNGKSDIDDFLVWCADKVGISWCINTNKCFDLPAKGLHSCSPYCLAFKRESLLGGTKHDKDKVKIEDRFQSYFSKSFELLEEEKQHELIEWSRLFTDTGRLYNFLEKHKELYEKVKEKEYIIFYLAEERNKYESANKKYLSSKLFNTEAYNILNPDNGQELLGTNDFKNGFNVKKPFLEHLSASFSITGRISSSDALGLYRFEQLMRYRIFPTPMPLFANEKEREALQQSFFEIAELDFDGQTRPSHSSIMKNLLDRRRKKGVGNYYLLYHSKGDILDFDFVSKFEYKLLDHRKRPWQIYPLFFKNGNKQILENVFDFQDTILPVIFNNALVVKRKDKPPIYKWFDDLSINDNTTAYLVRTFRMAFYNFIYKSRRSAITHTLFHRLMKNTIQGDILTDEISGGHHTKEWQIKEKLNIWFSLYNHFIHSPKNKEDMINHLESLREFTAKLVEIDSDLNITDNKQFAFLSGQVIRYLFSKISSDKQPHSHLDRFLKVNSGDRMKQEISKLFFRYKHEFVSKNFERAMAQLMPIEDIELDENFMPFLLAGYFSDNQLYGTKSNNNS